MENYPYQDSSLAVGDRVKDLLGRMTIDEKIGQLVQLFGWQACTRSDGQLKMVEEYKEMIVTGAVGSFYGFLRADPWTGVTLETGLQPKESAEAVNNVQRLAMNHTRLGIPILFGEECAHGHMSIGGTVFPVPIAAASTWNPELFEQANAAVAEETRSRGGAATYSPILDIVRDPRWGRTEETFGEDPMLCAAMGTAAVRGMQGAIPERGIAATIKHFAGYGASVGGRNGAPVHIGPIELREKDLYPFEKAVEAGAMSVMTAYNEIDGIPCTSNRDLLTGILRDEWGFDGFVITDCGALGMLAGGHRVAADGEEAAAMALEAGVDMEMSGEVFKAHLRSAIHSGKVSLDVLNQAVSRVLTIKFKLGLFENPYADPERAARVVGSDAHRKLALKVAQEGIVLLHNRQRTLPLSKSLRKLAVIGPNAANRYNQLGDYTSPQPPEAIVTILQGIRDKVGAEVEIAYAEGCRILGDDRSGFADALEAARSAEAAIVVVGGSSARQFGDNTIDPVTGANLVTEGDSDMDSGEGVDRTDLRLSGVQLELVKAIHATGVPVIVVFVNGRPVSEPWIAEHIDAVLEAWYPGQEGGHAVADILFGDCNPSGKMPISVPRSVGQLPVYYNHRRTNGKRYLEMDNEPLYRFGYGLSYTTFAYSRMSVASDRITADGETTVSIEVMNTGAMAGQEVVQVYIRDEVASVTRPVMELKAFKKIALEPGEAATVSFTIGPEQLGFVNKSLQRVVEPGLFTILAGGASSALLEAALNVDQASAE
ncbi:glycoside hydrolase family 3 N-terminal domain-containing protein [Paenibacillus mendelii]|uniref:Glycoside hydrolase family 3 N-terminal domain-containing protein n=1 Tax=Paenibacillus mendelii TaxID=206163 RepID=A0ABV6J4E4_9BACL|nr:glycoside hydrolase family 3 N-terminal domain-containing protein [Paenibacillus mendelii]MCQ6561741.1 glycoside hydrolase family 3 C-terminal domain-containing protein [Paenibacillus mendelii]